MSTELPVPLEFKLPPGWGSAPPDEVGAQGSAFVALHPASADNFVANITISGQVRSDPLETVADESIARLKASSAVKVTDRKQTGRSDAPGLAQVLRLHTKIDGVERELVQYQVYLGMSGSDGQSAVIELMLTATPKQLGGAVPDFQSFVKTVKPTAA